MTKQLDPDAVPPWIASLACSAGRDPSVVAGVDDDDCAVVRWEHQYIVITTDFLNARPIAVELGLAGMADLGRLLVVASLSDLCGSGAEPRAILVGAVLARGTTEEDFHSFMRGVHAEATRWKVVLVGGDTKLGSASALLAVAIGSAPTSDSLFLKNRAMPGDLLWCSGPLGACNAAVIGLTRHQMPRTWETWAKGAILMPKLPLELSRAVSHARTGRGGIDVSDGLGADLRRLCLASRVGVIVHASNIPVDREVCELATELGIEPWAFAFGCGGDYQFLVTTSPDHRTIMETLGLHLIGELTTSLELVLRLTGGRVVPLPQQGHRDARNVRFPDEILALVQEAAQSARE